MAEEDLSRQNELVDALLKKLEQVKTLWEELPTIDDIQEIGQAAGGLASDLKGARELSED